jgi:hypothetical protein
MDNNSWNFKSHEVEILSPQKENNISQNVKKIEYEKSNKNDDENQNNEYEDSLSYRSSQNSFNKTSKDIESSVKRKLSTISTSQSDFNYQELNGFSSEKIFISKKSFNGIQPINLFGNESNNALCDYYKETEEYYQNFDESSYDYIKTKNYMEKEKYYQNYFGQKEENNEYFKHKTDFIEEKKNIIIEENINYNANNIKEAHNINNEKYNENNEEINKNFNNYKDINNNIIINNNYINKLYINPNINFNNSINGSKYDYAMCCLGYYSVDCKLYIKINSYYFSFVV